MNPYVIIFAFVVWAASIAGVGYWQHQDGVTVTEAAYAKRDNKALADANKTIHDTEEKYRAIEQDHAIIQAGISTNYQEQLKNANQKTANLIATAHAGTFRLRDPGAIVRPPGGSVVSETAARAGGCDVQAGGGLLSEAATIFLIGEAGRSDEIVMQLIACQEVVVEDRK